MIYRVSLPDHRVEYVSPVVERILGYTPAEAAAQQARWTSLVVDKVLQ